MSFTCPRCGMTSGHPRDQVEGYCGNCHDWTGARPGTEKWITRCLDCGVIYIGVPTCGGAFEILSFGSSP